MYTQNSQPLITDVVEDADQSKKQYQQKQYKCCKKYFTCSAITLGAFGALFSILVFVQAAISTDNNYNSVNLGYHYDFISKADHGEHNKNISMNMNCTGNANGYSTILFEIGNSSSILDVIALQEYISQHRRRMCIYDRGGFGKSDFPVTPVYAGNRIFRDTYNMLVDSGEDLSYGLTLIGHQNGGEHAQIFAQLYPELVRGLGLLDAYPDYLELHMKPVFNWTSSQMQRERNRVRSLGASTNLSARFLC
ncbi:Alpha/beta_hydrolase fold-containing protein [Hexamita inflata]|uniref:Alpha/beta hydrolase fold-containing protein n=1 Tax=Hexamita inflata TaxID=28002 RepID=A0AA86UJP9_9EUKA|nr:Alpha/beta hydrolase fold-containing protein [Hexamita inflata]